MAVESGATVADDRISIVELPRGATGVEWGTDLSFVGVYVRALDRGGAAEASGLVAPGDQLVSINGTQVFEASFDETMALLGREAPAVQLEVFHGSRDELLAAAGVSTSANVDFVTVTVRDGLRVAAELRAPRGANLRDLLVDAGLDVYRGSTKWVNCGGKQMCGTCGCLIEEGGQFTNRKSNDEDSTLGLQEYPAAARLSCVTFVYGDVTVALQPDRGSFFFGSATSGSAW